MQHHGVTLIGPYRSDLEVEHFVQAISETVRCTNFDTWDIGWGV